MGSYDRDYVMTGHTFYRLLEQHGADGVRCATCGKFTKIGERVFAKPQKGKKSGAIRRHYDCAVQVNLVEC